MLIRRKQIQLSHAVILLAAMFFCGILSVLYGKELNWDVAHYHYYRPYAMLTGRDAVDYFPPSYIHQYINPTIDLLTYGLITYVKPLYAEFILGMIHGMNLALLYWIARIFCRPALAVMLALIGIYGPTAWPGMGSFQNDNLITLFVFSSLLILLKRYRYSELLAGFVLGLGVGLKLTASLFVIGMLAMLLCRPLPWRIKFRQCALFSACVFAGMLVTSGFWMYTMYVRHGNPFFPFFNSIFQSPDFAVVNWRDTRFLPKTFAQILFFPFYFWNGSNDDAPSVDFRFAILYGLLVIWGVQRLYSFFFLRESRRTEPENITRLFFIFFLVSYLAWESYFAIARYLAALEMLAPLAIYLTVQQLKLSAQHKMILLTILFYTLVFFMTPRASVRTPWYQGNYFNVHLPVIARETPKAIVLMSYTAYVNDLDPRPQTYLIPFFPKSWAFIGVPFWKNQYLQNENDIHRTLSLIDNKTPLFLLASDFALPELIHAAKSFHLTLSGPCERITSDRQIVTHQQVMLCPVRQV